MVKRRIMVMVVQDHDNGWPPIGAPLNLQRDDQRWSNFDTSVNAVSFGFVATAILISMFLVMAIFERFLRPTSPLLSPSGRRTRRRLDCAKLAHPSPKMSLYASWVSVLMPGDEIPTFIAHPAPAPCCPERISWPSHQQHNTINCSTSNTLPSINQV
ncbi:uncharacterized protein LOC113853048 [Abrus precatorius]|uniref:Uncharacterized protein LOC113853048 n=1 Tax=Abrus precatorius TaxID=3816 RepID=A0A8B8K7S4_ABRPR|nr:uncharacterized protein LOC113853048 [Abrus precatorius]